MKLVKTFYFNSITFLVGFLQCCVIHLKECYLVFNLSRWKERVCVRWRMWKAQKRPPTIKAALIYLF